MTNKTRLALFLLLITVAIIILANSGYLPREIRRLYDFPYGDKLGHFFLLGTLNFVLNRAALASRVEMKPAALIWAVSLILAFFITLEEFSQQNFPRRTFSLLDLAFSYAGIASFAWLAARLHHPA